MALKKLTLAAGLVLAFGVASVVAAFGPRSPGGAGSAAEAAPAQAAAAEAPPPDDPVLLAALRRKSQHNLKILGIAMHNYADGNAGRMVGPAILDKQGKPLLSWRVALLPYVDEDNLYKQFRLDEPWDGPHNKALLARMPRVYAPVVGAARAGVGKTYYQGLVGKGAAFEKGQRMTLPASFTDGLSNTILFVEAATPVEWTRPDDLAYDAGGPLPKFGGLFEGSFHALFADGAVRALSRKADETNLRAALTRMGGEIIHEDMILAKPGEGDGPVDLKDLPKQNEQLKKALGTLAEDVRLLKEEIELLKAQVEFGRPVDARTLKLLHENAELRQRLDKVIGDLEMLKSAKEGLRKELGKAAPENRK